jgi:hypothetical protein
VSMKFFQNPRNWLVGSILPEEGSVLLRLELVLVLRIHILSQSSLGRLRINLIKPRTLEVEAESGSSSDRLLKGSLKGL